MWSLTDQHGYYILAKHILAFPALAPLILCGVCVCVCVCCSNNILRGGQWSESGCVRNETLSNASTTVCECDHLTHFAILLSAAPINASNPITLSLGIIGYVGVSISLVAMALTILTFIVLKYS